MTKAEAQNNNALPHDLILEGRGKLTVTGVRRMLRCDPDSAAMETCLLYTSDAADERG